MRYETRPLVAWTDPETPQRRSSSRFKASWADTCHQFESGQRHSPFRGDAQGWESGPRLRPRDRRAPAAWKAGPCSPDAKAGRRPVLVAELGPSAVYV